MTASAPRAHEPTVCGACLRRGWLLAALAGPLDYCCRNRERLLDALALGDHELIGALGGSRRRELERGYRALTAEQALGREDAQASTSICRHDARFPSGLSFASSPRALWAAPNAARLCGLAHGPVVALLGAGRASDYGTEVARALGRGLAVAGVAVAVLAREGICAAALAGALDANGAVLCALPCGADRAGPAMSAATRRRAVERGCLVAEVPRGTPARQWAHAAAERVVVGVAQLTILVEADESRRELAPATVAHVLGRPLAAVPGRVTSPLSRGTNALLAAGASLVRDPQDALELLGRDPSACSRREPAFIGGLEPGLRAVLEDVGGGRDAPDLLVQRGRALAYVLDALSELELRGLLVRGDGGRYMPSAAATRAGSARAEPTVPT